MLLKARPFSEGSFEIPLELVILGGASLFDNQPLIDEILRMLKQYFEAKKLLRGQPPPSPRSDGGSVVIHGDLEISNSVVNILVNAKVNTAVDRAAVDVAADETIKHIKVLTGEERTVLTTVEREELEYFRTGNDTGPRAPTRDRQETTEVIIKSPVFEGNARWKFIWKSHTILADISDEDFMERVRAGNEAFAAGDRLEVDLVVHERYDEALATYEESGYSIMRVHRHSKRPRRGERTLFDESGNETR